MLVRNRYLVSAHGCPVFLAPFISEDVISPMYVLSMFIKKSAGCKYMDFWVLYSVPLSYVCFYMCTMLFWLLLVNTVNILWNILRRIGIISILNVQQEKHQGLGFSLMD